MAKDAAEIGITRAAAVQRAASSGTRALVERAADAAVAAAADDPRLRLGAGDPRAIADLVVEAIIASEHVARGAAPASRVPVAFVDRLRAELIREAAAGTDSPAASEVLAVLARLETLRVELLARDAATFPTGMDFVAGVAHDLRSPLTSILFLAETLQSELSGEINDVQRRQLGIIYSAALGLVTVASDIIELARNGSGLTERTPTRFSVTEVMESVHDIVRPLAEEKGLTVHLFPPGIDQRFGYPLALSRVLLNLTTNGLKFTDDGFVEIAVRALDAVRLEFSVRDTGKGYTRQAIDDLYHPFRRSRDGKKYGFSGTGLGLTISRRLVVAMGSSLEVESRPGWGTRFFFELDLPPGPEPDRSAA